MTAVELARETVKILYGSRHARKEQAEYFRNLGSLSPSIAAMEARSGSEGSAEAPIFIFSAGWRSGSTMVQRLLMSGRDTLIWGEAYDRCSIIQRLTETAFAHSDRWPNQSYLRQPASLDTLSGEWVANLYPPPDALKQSYRAFIETLLAVPARALGAERWGFKEVRLGINEARFLRWIFPQAKFLLVYRNPYDAYLSYKSFQPAKNWYVRWPDQPAFTTAAFARHWRRLTEDFVANAEDVGGLLVKYEDLVSGLLSLDALAEYCGLSIDRNVLNVRLGGSDKAASRQTRLSRLERFIIRHYTGSAARHLGYGPK